jgi:ubiquinone/menaquinone biosynthesis C-methylase UbiE
MQRTSSIIAAAGLLVAATATGQEAEPHTKGHGGHGPKHGMHHDFSDAEAYSRQFDSDERRAWQQPEHVVELMAIEPGMTVVDIGAGTGFFEPYLAAAVGAEGRVLALDVEEGMVDFLTKRVAEQHLAVVEPRLVEYDDPGLAEASVDRILVVNTWHHIDDRPSYTRKLAAALKPGGTVTIVDFEKSSPHGPPPRHRLTAEQVASELTSGGLEAEALEEKLENQYVVHARLRSRVAE